MPHDGFKMRIEQAMEKTSKHHKNPRKAPIATLLADVRENFIEQFLLISSERSGFIQSQSFQSNRPVFFGIISDCIWADIGKFIRYFLMVNFLAF